MSDFLNKMLQDSIDREAKKIVADGATEQDRYGHLLDSVKGRDLQREESERKKSMISNLNNNRNAMKEEIDRENKEQSRKLNRIIMDVSTRESKQANEFLTKNKRYLDKAKETISRERNKTYFS